MSSVARHGEMGCYFAPHDVNVWLGPDRVRMRATLMLIDLNGSVGVPAGTSALFSNNPGPRATGGTCFGDSGGQIFKGDTSTVVAVTSFGLNGNCEGGGYRVDAADDLDWLESVFGDLL